MSQPYIPRQSAVLGESGTIARDWDRWFQGIAQQLTALTSTVLSGPDADPNGIVIGSPGSLYRQIGAATSALYVKESGVNTDTGWILK